MLAVYRSTLLCFAIVAALMVAPASANRANYGQSAFPIWSPLTYFERDAISTFRAGDENTPETLLALSLIASGVRENSDYQHASQRLESFTTNLNKHLINNDDHLLTGRLINQHVHQNLLRAQDASPPGYDVDQSRLMGIFENGQYNCVSSALLYAVLARKYQLDGVGVLLPSHVFIELTLPDGRQIEVETTSPSGYDQVHDEAFYERTNHEWFATRGLQPATYSDYLAREKVALYQLAARNMLNQHTSETRMSLQDSLRLAEISAFIDPSYELAQVKRLYFYNREIHKLILDKDWSALSRLFNTTYNTVLADAARHVNEEYVQQALQMYLSGAMLGYANMGEIEPTLDAMGELLNRDWSLSESRQELENRVANAVSVLLRHLVDKQQFDEGLLVLSLVEGHINRHPSWGGMTQWLYIRWAENHWQERRWEDVIFTLKDVQNVSPTQNDKHPLELIESAYYNWVLELSNARDFAAAEGVVEQCKVQISDANRCKKADTLLHEQEKRFNES